MAPGIDNTFQSLHQRWAAAFNARDFNALLSMYEPDAVLVTGPGNSLTGHDGILAFARDITSNGDPKIQLAPVAANTYGDIALVHGRWTITSTGPDGKPSEITGLSTEILRRGADGQWRYIIDSPFTPVP